MTAFPRLVATVALGALGVVALKAQGVPPAPRDNANAPHMATSGTAALGGRVVNDKTNQPLRRATVTLSATDGLRLATVTDESGAFAFEGLPAGRFSLGAGRPSFVGASYGAKRPNSPGTSIALADGERKADVVLRLVPGGVITGVVRNGLGEPLPGMHVVVLHMTYGFDTGERNLTSVNGGFGEASDERGVYRVFGLPPDDYYVVVTSGIGINRGNEIRESSAAEWDWATHLLRGGAMAPATAAPPPGPTVDYAPVFYPGSTTQAAAAAVTVKAGEERSGVDITLDPTPTAKVTVHVVSSDGEAIPPVLVNVIAHDTISGVPFSGFGTARGAGEGTFVSSGLTPGDYTITARPSGAAGRASAAGARTATRYGLATVTVNGRDVEATLSLESGVTVTGRLVFDGTTAKPPADLTKMRVTLTPERSKTPSLGVSPAIVDATGAFTFTGVSPGRYRVSAIGAGGWQVRSATVSGRDALDVPIEIGRDDVSGLDVVLTDHPAEISGSLLDAKGNPAPDFFIVLFPTDQNLWKPLSRRIQAVRPASDGHYRLQNLPAGEYLLAAATDVEQSEWYDPTFLAQLVATATKITLADGEKKVQQLKLGSPGTPQD